MLDGDLGPAETKAVEEHIRQCESCAQYYKDMALMSGAVREPDAQPPAGFSERWKKAVADAAHPAEPRTRMEKRTQKKPRRAWRMSRVIPVLACSILAVFVVSTALVNPQAFGLGGESLRSTQATVTPSDQGTAQMAVEESTSPIVFGNVVLPTRAPSKPATQNDEYWEETFWSSATPSQVVTGDIEPTPDDLEKEDADASENGEDASGQSEPFDVAAPGEATIAAMRSYAQGVTDLTITDDDEALFVEGPADDIALFLVAFGFEGPENVTKLRISCEALD